MLNGYAHTNRRGDGVTDEQEAKLFARMREARAQEDHAYRSMSGADVSGAPLYSVACHFYQLLWEGVNVETAIERCDAAWRAYASENNAKVAAAPKIKRGPSSGHSTISHRWTDPERFQAAAIHLRTMARMIFGKRFRIIDDRDDTEVLGGVVGEDNVYVRAYGSLLENEKRPDDLVIGESTRKRYALSGERPTVYRIERIA